MFAGCVLYLRNAVHGDAHDHEHFPNTSSNLPAKWPAQLDPKMLQDSKMGLEASKMKRWADLGPNLAPRSPNIDAISARERIGLVLNSPVGHDAAHPTCKNSFKIPIYLAT